MNLYGWRFKISLEYEPRYESKNIARALAVIGIYFIGCFSLIHKYMPYTPVKNIRDLIKKVLGQPEPGGQPSYDIKSLKKVPMSA
jgi:hypothetical protein